MRSKQVARKRPVLRAAERLSQQLSHYLAAAMARVAVTDLEAHVLIHLGETGRPVADLQRALGVRPSTLTGVIDRLESRRYVGRELNRDDRRSFLIVPTARGARAAAEVRAFADHFEREVRARVGEADVEAFLRVVAAVEEVVG